MSLLGTYLNDHLAGATAGVELAKRARSSNKGTPLGDFLVGLTAEIEQDRATLIELMDHLEIGRDRLKVAAAWAGEKFGRLKPNGQILGYSPLSRLIELEFLHIGITGKLELWRALSHTVADRAADFDFDALAARADDQRTRLEKHRLEAARQALA